jgi:hypothetical protein
MDYGILVANSSASRSLFWVPRTVCVRYHENLNRGRSGDLNRGSTLESTPGDGASEFPLRRRESATPLQFAWAVDVKKGSDD